MKSISVVSSIAAALAAPVAHAEIALGAIGGSKIALEGLLQADGNWFNDDLANLAGAGRDRQSELRRAELALKSDGSSHLQWMIGYDAHAEKFLDVNLKYTIGGDSHYLQLGQFKQPNSLEELSSTKHNDFISKASVTNLYGVSRRLGLAYGFIGEGWTLTASYFSRELTSGLAHGNGHGLRGTWTPIDSKDRVLHLGLAFIDHDTRQDSLRLRVRPNADLATARLVDTGTMDDADRIRTTSVEAMWINGPFKLQAEGHHARVTRLYATDHIGTGHYLTAVWNITGESWGYENGVPVAANPSAPSRGIWQLALRHDALDLDHGPVRGGKMRTHTIGVNWYWHSNFKLMLDYVRVDSSRQGIDDAPRIIEARAQFHW